MKKPLLALLLACLMGGFAPAQDTIQLQEAEVTASRTQVAFSKAARNITVISRKEIEETPARNLNELLEYVSNVDIRQRGQNGVQADISLRGSSFEQVLILLNGIKMTDAQTGHHNLNLPISLLDIERIEILHGGAARIYGPGAFAGAINIITKPAQESAAKLQLLSGENGLLQYGLSASIAGKNHYHSLSWQQQSSDGFIRNTDHEMQNIFWQSELNSDRHQLRFNMGQNTKAFGAQNFYSSRFPDQFERTQTQFISLSDRYQIDHLAITARAYFRRHNDRFELFREDFGFYQRLPVGGFANQSGDTIPWYNGHNYHQTDVYGAEANLAYESKWGVSSLGFDFRSEEILSNVLGNEVVNIVVKNEHPSAFYLRSESRENRSIFFEHNYSKNNLFVSAGVLYNSNTAFEDAFYPGIDLSYQLNEFLRPYASYNRSFRFPTYTDLYFNLGGIIGSDQLETEESDNYELGLKFQGKQSYGHLAAFRREGNNLIDWIRFTGSNITQAANLTEVIINGVEADYVLPVAYFEDIPYLNSVRISYTYLDSEDNSDGFESNYVLDFLQHKGDLVFQLKLSEIAFIDWAISYQNRRGEFVNPEGNEVDYPGIFISDAKFSIHQQQLDVFLQASNVFNERYFDIGNVENPGRWISVGLNYRLDFKAEKGS